MEEKKVWMKRSEEWIKQNPGKPTMYKDYPNNANVNSLVFDTRRVVKKRYEKRTSGIYVILCEPAKSVYVGMSENIESRLRSHKFNINRKYNKSPYIKICEDIETYGVSSFELKIYEEVNQTSNLFRKETETMHLFKRDGYNLYNQVIGELSKDLIYCKEELQPQINKLINLATKDIDKFNNIIAMVD
jgi:predicted GIY-YIG superfamily endonuclease